LGLLVNAQLAHYTTKLLDISAVHMIELIIFANMVGTIGVRIDQRIIGILKKGNHGRTGTLWRALFQYVLE